MKRLVIGLLLLSLLMTGLTSCKNGQDLKVVATAADYDVLYEEYRYVILSCRDEMTAEGLLLGNGNEDDYRAELERRVTEALTDTYSVLAACKDRLPGLSPECDELKEEIQSNLQAAQSACGGKKAYRESLKNRHMTEHLMENQLGIALMQMRLEDAIVAGSFAESENTLSEWLQDGNLVHTYCVTVPLSAGIDVANRLRNSALSGNTQASDLITPDDASLGITGKKSYHYRNLGDADTEQNVFALTAEGAVSPLLQTTDSYTFYVRLSDDIQTVLSLQLSALLSRYRSQMLSDAIAPYASQGTPIYNDYGSSIDILKIQ